MTEHKTLQQRGAESKVVTEAIVAEQQLSGDVKNMIPAISEEIQTACIDADKNKNPKKSVRDGQSESLMNTKKAGMRFWTKRDFSTVNKLP